jgi:nitroimidazol reductase NimA-like FMN-containing flavoprotein (pyridoxamine 5'-phosphate oxidase superfamily)
MNEDPIGRPLSADVEGLRLQECWAALASATVGRLAVLGRDGAPDIFPINHLVHDARIYLRSAPGAKIVDVVRDARVAFEVDAIAGGIAWSVVVRGTATRLDADDEIVASGVRDLVSANPTAKYNYLRIDPREITGRRFRVRGD